MLLAAAPTGDLAGPLLAELEIWRDKPGTFLEYQVTNGERPEPIQVRLALMEPLKTGKLPARWVCVTMTTGVERVEMWAVARKGRNGLPVRDRMLIQFRDRVLELPPPDLDGEGPPPVKAPDVVRKGKVKLKTPAGEFLAEEVVTTVEGTELRLWLAPRVPMGGKQGGIVKMVTGDRSSWELIGSGLERPRPPPTPTETGAAAPRNEPDDP
jgi:hypothetical protein